MTLLRAMLFPACVLISACASTPAPPATASTLYLVRHAEKDLAAGKDPPLTPAGRTRAEQLSTLLAKVPLEAIYSTATQRTRQTAAPTAQAHGLAILEYDASDAVTFASQLRQRYPHGNVLIIGHSNTLPALVRALCHCTVGEMDEATYGIRYTVQFDSAGRSQLQVNQD
jgi:broad specificity phosphatase PhoE